MLQEEISVSNYFSSEIDKYTIQVTQKNFPNTIQLGDVREIDCSKLSKIELLIGGSPCQDLSKLKQGKGLKGEKSFLFYEYTRILKKTNPKFFLFENVIPRKKDWKEIIDQELGVEGIIINSDLFVPQNRPRVYWTNIIIDKLPVRPNWNFQYYQYRRTYFRKNMSGVCPCLTANMGTGGHNVPLKSENLNDKLSPIEVELLQGLPENYTEGISNSQRYKALGNAWTIPVIRHIFKGINNIPVLEF